MKNDITPQGDAIAEGFAKISARSDSTIAIAAFLQGATANASNA